ncbi:response regulator [Pedobacter sp. HMF7647]|uniref:histidine kinase n=1 Tax=Hufsiella arboris TaxID=2695275 RepID=A0A7K1YBS4_9SPHI|nr:hybrid sensor histidine kinase/response regulator [Hufsiella arboris]MXV51811.1 response regulator [Hufsiella arboris]
MILIVDDKPENIFSLKQILELHNFEVDIALSGEEALKKILKNDYALIILDVQMPGMDGFEVAEAVTGYSKSKDTPIIFLSAVNTDKKFITKGYASGGLDYITKPVDADILLLKVKTFYRLYEQTHELYRMQQALLEEIEYRKEAEKKKDEFISIASHELKTPLTSIKAYLQLSQRAIDNDVEKTKSYLDRTGQQLEKLNGLIADLLDISKIESGKLKLNKEPFAFGPLLNSAIDIITQTHDDFNVLVNGNYDDAKLFGDAIRIEQVLINFLTNAFKYSPDRKEAHVSANVNGNVLTVRVTDFGIGIPEEKQKDIFEKFYRVEANTNRFQGLGIGLYICAEILRLHGAEFGVESSPDKGSTFYFRMPVIQ